MIFPDLRVSASGPTESVRLAVVGMAPAKNEVAAKKPFVGFSGRILDDSLQAAKWSRSYTYVTNLVEFFIDDNDLFSVPHPIMEQQRARFWAELDKVRPNVLLILGGDTLHLLTCRAERHNTTHNKQLCDKTVKDGITKWRGSIFEIVSPTGRPQKCVAAMHPSNFIRGQWRWLPVFRYLDVVKAVTQSVSSELKLSSRNSIVGPSFSTVQDFLTEANEQPFVSIDYEGRGHITCLGVCWTASEAMCIPLNRVGSSHYWTPSEEAIIWRLWNALLRNPRVKKIAQNAAYEWIKSWLYGIYPTPLGIDTMHLHHCLYPDFGGVDDEWTARKRRPDFPGHGLAFITSQYTDQEFYKDDGRHWRPEMGEEVFWRYNALDVMVTFEAAMKMLKEAENAGLLPVYDALYRQTFDAALRIEWFGHPINASLRDSARRDTLAEIAALSTSLEKQIGRKVVAKASDDDPANVLNLASPKQMLAWLSEKGYATRVNRNGRPTVDKDTLQMLYASTHHKVLLDIMTLRKLQDFVNDILDQQLDEFNRMHCHVKLGGTNGTRWSTTESILGGGTNTQNLPRAGIARKLFLP